MLRTLACLAVLAGASVPASAVRGQPAEAPLSLVQARVGIGGQGRSGFWTPIWLTLRGGSAGARGQLEVVSPDSDGVPVVYSDASPAMLDLPAGEQTERLVYAKLGPVAAPLSVQLRSGQESGRGEVVWSQAIDLPAEPLGPTRELIVGIGPPVGIAEAVATLRRPAAVAFAFAQTTSAADLPDRWWGYEGVDTVVLSTTDRQLLASLHTEQVQALRQWQQLGGRLIVSLGGDGEALLAADSPWAWLAPGRAPETVPLRDWSGLEAFGGVDFSADNPDFQRNRPQVTRLAEAEGVVLLDEAVGGSSRPLVVRGASGFGEIIFVGIDLDHPALAAWPGRTRLLANLLAGNRPRTDEQEAKATRRVVHLGYEDLVGQLRAALDQFSGVQLVNFTTVAVLVVGYLLLIGPADYLLLSRLGLPRHWTWFTFTLVAAGFCFAAWYLGREAHGNRVRLRQVEIVDLDARQRIVRGVAWTHLYSPTTTRFDVAPRFAAEAVGANEVAGSLAWQGLPGSSLGGLDSRQVALARADAYHVLPPGPAPALQGLPVQTASSKSLATRWWGTLERDLSSRLVRSGFGPPGGELTNPFPFELTNSLLVYEDWLFRLGKIGPGQTIQISPRDSLNLEYRLTERTVVRDRDVTTRWDQASTDLPRIVRMLMFHEAARGQTYTGLTHRYEAAIDLSDHLRLGQAILVGQGAQGVVQLTDGREPLAAAGDAEVATWCRVVFPVLPAKEAPRP